MKNEATSRGGEHYEGAPPPAREQGPGYAVLLDDQSGERFAAPTRFAGYALHDPLGREIGKVEKVFVNGYGGPEYVAVKVGSIWRKKTVLIPVESASADDELRILALR